MTYRTELGHNECVMHIYMYTENICVNEGVEIMCQNPCPIYLFDL